MATLPAFPRTFGRVSATAPKSPCAPRHGTGVPGGPARRFRLVLVCALALALVLAPGCVVRSRGQYDVSVSKTSRS